MNFSGKYCVKQDFYFVCLIKTSVIEKFLYSLDLHKYLNIQATSNHKIFIKLQWQREDEIKKEDSLSKYIKSARKKEFIVEEKKITSLKVFYKHKTYDIQNNEYLNFIIDGVIVHNSIEQDADLVMMIYKNKEEDQKNNGEKSEILDITISKNRNGPIGSFQLMFHGNTSTFSNINKSY